MFAPGDHRQLAERIMRMMKADDEEKRTMSRCLRKLVVENHNLDHLIPEVVARLEPDA
jgi:hypothetical protein